VIDEHLVQRLVRSQFPELSPIGIERLGEGCDSVAFVLNGTWVFRFPKRADVERQLDTEMTLLRWLTRRGAPLAVPDYSFEGQPSEQFPRRFGGYRRLPGTTANRVALTASAIAAVSLQLARFLSWLHALPVDEALALGVADQRQSDAVSETRREAIEGLPVVLRVIPDAPIDDWRAYLEGAQVRAAPEASALVHNDLAAEHVLVDATMAGVTGVIDWSDAAVGDPAIDFGGIFHWGGAALLDAVLARYGGEVSHDVLSRARFFAAARGVLDVSFGLERNDQVYIDHGVRAIRWATNARSPSPPGPR
jgi:aminoglycoside phosphotransferase (APT) family kinase protein